MVFVPLAPLARADQVLPAIARALDVREPATTTLPDAVLAFLRDRAMLLVLDNFEHVLGAAPLVRDLVAMSERLAVLVTSRAALRVSGEQEVPVPPLAVPPALETAPTEQLAGIEAVQLFVDRVRAIVPAFILTPAIAPAVAEICRRLDGLPLAIELAAARVRLLPPPVLLSRLEAPAAAASGAASGTSSALAGAEHWGALRLLAGGPQDVPPRHQTLQAAIAWSYGLLAPAQQRLFRRLAVFAGGCTLDAAEAVCGEPDDDAGAVLNGLEALAAQSMLQQRSQPDGTPRLVMLETIREYALEQLGASGELDALRRRHAAFYLTLANTDDAARTPAWFDAVEREQANLRTAMRWCMAQGSGAGGPCAEWGLLIGAALAHLWEVRGHLTEGRRALAWLLEQPAPEAPSATYSWARATVLTKAGHLAWRQGDFAGARSLYEAGLALRRATNQQAMIAFSLQSLGALAFEQGDLGTARACHEEALARRRTWGRRYLCASLTHLGRVAQEQGDDATARALHQEALALARQYGVRHIVAAALNDLGRLAWRQGDLATARAHHEEALAIARALGDRRETALALDALGRVAHAQGDTATAARRHAEALAVAADYGDRPRMAWCLEGLAAVAAARGDCARAARLFGAAAAVRDATGAPLPPSQRSWHARHLSAARAGLDQSAFDAAWRDGQAMALAEVLAYAQDGG